MKKNRRPCLPQCRSELAARSSWALRLAFVVCLGGAGSAQAQLNWSQSLEWWAQHGALQPAASLLNPDNALLALARQQQLTEARWQVKGRSDNLDIHLRLRGVWQQNNNGQQRQRMHDLYASQAFVRAKFSDRFSLSAGRMLLTWGQGNFRSPSNPFYYDAGRNQPLRELSGLDAVSALYSGDLGSLQFIHVFSSGHTGGAQGENFSGSQTGRRDFRQHHLLKWEKVGEQTQTSLIASHQHGGGNYLGANLSWTVNDAWLVYGELGYGRRPATLQFSPAAVQVLEPGKRAVTALAGASYTMENGQTLNLEFLHDGHGLSRQEQGHMFDLARRSVAQLGGGLHGLGLSNLGRMAQGAPVLLARNYLAAAWQSNVQDSSLYWRIIWNGNLRDRSSQLNGIIEKNIAPNWSVFATASYNFGANDTEFGSLYRSSYVLGVKYFAF